jgi:ATP-binding cassette, subfamily B, bacterial MsbA
MKVYRRLLAYAKPYRKFILPFFIFTLIAVFFSIFQFALIIPLLNFLFDNETQGNAQKFAHAPSFSLSGDFFKNY